MKVKDVMVKKVLSIDPKASIIDAIRLFKKHNIAGVPVLDKGKLVGIITESDIMDFMEVHEFKSSSLLPAPFDFIEAVIDMRAEVEEVQREFDKLRNGKVNGIMKKKVITIAPDAHVSEAADLMSEHKINRLPVIEKGKLVGIVTRSDLVKSLV